VLNTSVFEFPTGRSVIPDRQFFLDEFIDDLPAVPAMPETLLAMELQFNGCAADLRGVTEAVLGDLGATIQVLRLAGREYGAAEGRPVRIEDCISDLGLHACLDAAASATLVRGVRQRAVVEMWEHSKEIAQYCRLLVEETPGAINPHEAYLAGLLHSIGALPAVLGWERTGLASDRALAALRLAERWNLPACLKDFFCEVYLPGYSSRWSEMMTAAHDLAAESWARCPLCDAAIARVRACKGHSAC
jgi:HD-like signal output (HDOD) protein